MSDLYAMLSAWADVGLIILAVAAVAAIGIYLHRGARRIWAIDRQLATEMRIRAGERQSAADLAACRAIAALPVHDPRRTP